MESTPQPVAWYYEYTNEEGKHCQCLTFFKPTYEHAANIKPLYYKEQGHENTQSPTT